MSELTRILGGMIIDKTFRAQMEEDIDQTLQAHGITLNREERNGLEPIVDTFRSGELNPCVNTFLSHCPQWPCGLMDMDDGNQSVSTAKTSGPKKPALKPVRAGAQKTVKKTVKKTASRTTAGARKKKGRS